MPKGDEIGVIETSLPGFGIGVHDHSSDPQGSILQLYDRGSIARLRHFGTGHYEAWYGPSRTQLTQGSATMAANRLYALPFILPKSITLDRIGIRLTSTAAGKFLRLGIYLDDGNLYPQALALDSGALPCTSGIQSAIINYVATPPLIWLALLFEGTPIVSTFQPSLVLNILGSDNTLAGSIAALYHAQAYGALPNPFPVAAPVLVMANVAALWDILVRLSAN